MCEILAGQDGVLFIDGASSCPNAWQKKENRLLQMLVPTFWEHRVNTGDERMAAQGVQSRVTVTGRVLGSQKAEATLG